MTRVDGLFLRAIRVLIYSALIGACLLCEAVMWLGYVDYWIVRLLQGG